MTATSAPSELAARYAMFNGSGLLAEVHGGQFLNVGWRPFGACGAGAELLTRLLVDAPSAPCVVLDVGCGRAPAAALMAEKWPQARVIGLDYSLPLLAAARPERGVHLVRADAVALPIATEAVDLVVSVEAALHFRRRTDFFAQARRVLRPGGRLLLTDLLLDPDAEGWRGFVGSANREGDLASYGQALRSAGLAVLDLRDVTADTWLPYTAALIDAAGDRSAGGAGAIARALGRHPVIAYVIAIAERPR